MGQDKRRVVTTTIYVTVAVVALYFIVSFVGKSLLNLEITDSSAIFLSLIPFVVYLVVSGRIREFRGGGFEIKFKEAFEKEVLFEHQPIEFDVYETIIKGREDELPGKVLQTAEKPFKTLALKPSHDPRYKLTALRRYLEELTKLESFKYVVFFDREGRFEGFVSARSLLVFLKDENKGRDIVNRISSGEFDGIPGFRKDFIQDAVSNREALKILDKQNLTDIAVIDTNGEFLGFASRETITVGAVKGLLGSASE